jgi:hypothetical protein
LEKETMKTSTLLVACGLTFGSTLLMRASPAEVTASRQNSHLVDEAPVKGETEGGDACR